MMRVAVFVDAGYLFAQGSLLISGTEGKKARGKISLKAKEILTLLTKHAVAASNKKELLRIYWYDGAPASGPSPAQSSIAQQENVKLRLGQLNSAGQQKGVDSLIVIDLTELARNKAISDAVVLAGDEDIRIAVQIAQNHGVRVHLLGIGGISHRGSQSYSLQNEADTIKVWTKSDVASFMTVESDPPKAEVKTPVKEVAKVKQAKPIVEVTVPDNSATLVAAASDVLAKLEAEPKKVAKILKIVEDGKTIPGDVVKLLYGALRTRLDREAVKSEKDKAREFLKATILGQR
jgi:uncharacterized LabA/DUF88 family protein